jgi:cell division septal protein FtsQ
MSQQEVFTYADVARKHIFWIEPDIVRDNVRRYPTVADAEVHLSWPPNMIHIVVEERAPAIIWEQNETAVWVDIQGNTMALRENRDDLIRIIAADPLADGPLGDSGNLGTEVVYGALQLQELRPDVLEWRYDVTRGLGFQNENGWIVWLGTGTDMPQKLQIYEALQARLLAEGRNVREINLSNPDAPVYMSLE